MSRLRPKITCADGFTLSVQASEFHYCPPKVSNYPLDEYATVEVGYPWPSRPEPWDQWEQYTQEPEQPTETVYGWVPLELVEALIESHGGRA